MKRLIALSLLVASCHEVKPPKPPGPGLLPGEEVALGKQPEVPPLQPFDAPLPRVEKLKNGLEVWLVERNGDGIETVLFASRAGATSDPAGKGGLASLTAALMDSGAAGRSQTEVAAAADAIGAALTVNASQDALSINVSAMSSNLEAMVRLLADVALRPNLAEEEWKRVKAQREALLISQKADPAVIAQRAFAAAVYGENALGRPVEGTLDSVKDLQLADARKFYAALGPKNAALVAVGGAPAEEVLRALEAAFGSWDPRPEKLPPAPEAPVPAQRPRMVLSDFPQKPQSVVIVGQPAVPRASPDHLALEAWNNALGGSFTSRLNQNLRELHGYTYGAGSRFAFGRGPGPFSARSSVKTDVTGAALSEILKEIDRAVAEPVADEELEKARALLSFDLSDTLSHSGALASAVAQMWLYNLPRDEFRTFVPRLRALTTASLQEAVKRVLDPPHMTISIAGDKKKVEPQLK